MKRTLGLAACIALLATPAIAQKVTVDYAHGFDYGAVKTFTYVETQDTNTGSQLTDDRIHYAIVRELKEGGLTEVESDADIYVTYHVTTEDRTVLNTTSYGYGGWGPGWGGYGHYGYGGYGYGGGGMGGATTTSQTYTEGTLVIDAYEPGEKKLIWRGTGTVTVKNSPSKQTKQIDKILAKIGKKWDKILKNQGK